MNVRRFARPATMPRNVVWFERLAYVACGCWWIPILLPAVSSFAKGHIAWWGLSILLIGIALVVSCGMIWSVSRSFTQFSPVLTAWFFSLLYVSDALFLNLKLKPLLNHSLPDVPGAAAKLITLSLALPAALYVLIRIKRFNLFWAFALSASTMSIALMLMLELPKRLGPSVGTWIGTANLLIASGLLFTRNARVWFGNRLSEGHA